MIEDLKDITTLTSPEARMYFSMEMLYDVSMLLKDDDQEVAGVVLGLVEVLTQRLQEKLDKTNEKFEDKVNEYVELIKG